MEKEQLILIRENEKISHTAIYTSYNLYEAGSWLSKPIKTVVDILPFFSEYKDIHILDLGCGVGRNAIYLAEKFCKIACKIDCIDILPLAIDKLEKNVKKQCITAEINGIVMPIEDYVIEKATYDFILAISALEHVDTEETFKSKLIEIEKGIKKNGIVCFAINTEVEEQDVLTNEKLLPQFEVNLSTPDVISILLNTFEGWKVLKQKVVKQKYEIPRNDVISCMKTNVVTFVARKERNNV